MTSSSRATFEKIHSSFTTFENPAGSTSSDELLPLDYHNSLKALLSSGEGVLIEGGIDMSLFYLALLREDSPLYELLL
jgi:hypothetical protein